MPSQPQLLQHDFTAGIRRSRARDDLGRSAGANVLWDVRDYIIGRLGVPLGKRGGWGYQGTFDDSEVTGTQIRAMSNDPFNGGNSMRAFDTDLNIWVSQAPFTTWTLEHDYNAHGSIYPATGLPKQNGVFIADGLFFTSSNGTLYGSTHNELYGQDWNMSAAGGGEVIYLATHLNRLVGLDVNENLWFGDPSINLSVWDTDAKYNLGQPGRGLTSLGEKLMVFFDGQIRMVLGSNPAGYGVTQDDITIRQFTGDIGLLDAFSIVHWNTQAIWADHNGIYATDGSNYPLDLTWAGNAKDLWLEFIRNYVDTSTTRVACGIYSDLLVCSMTDIVGNTHIDTIVCDLNRRTWSRWQNTPFTCFVRGSLNAATTYAGIETVVHNVAQLAPVLDPTSANSTDADGTDVEPSFETAYYRFGPQDGRIHKLMLGYEIDFIGTAATLTNQNIVYNAITPGEDGNNITVQIVTSGTGSAAVVTVTGTAILITIGSNTTKNSIRTAVNITAAALVLVPVIGAPGTDIGVSALAATNLAGGARGVQLQVDYATDPKADPAFENYAGAAVYLEAADIHGADDEGYHWRSVPVREQTPGIAVRVRQVGPSAKTAIHGIGIETQSYPTHSER